MRYGWVGIFSAVKSSVGVSPAPPPPRMPHGPVRMSAWVVRGACAGIDAHATFAEAHGYPTLRPIRATLRP